MIPPLLNPSYVPVNHYPEAREVGVNQGARVYLSSKIAHKYTLSSVKQFSFKQCYCIFISDIICYINNYLYKHWHDKCIYEYFYHSDTSLNSECLSVCVFPLSAIQGIVGGGICVSVTRSCCHCTMQ